MALNTMLTHHNATVNGIQLHYVTAGVGEPLVLLHGYPQTHHAWHKIIPQLARHFTIIAPDLRGLGDSERPETGYEKQIIAEDIYQIVRSLDYEKIYLVGHDYGGSTAYFLASEHPELIQKLVVIECAPPGLGETGEVPLVPGGGAWHRVFHLVADLPEALVAGREKTYLNWFYQHYSRNPEAISDSDLDEYIRTYSQPGAMKAGFEYYRAYFEDTERGRKYAKTKLQMPVLAIGADSVYGESVEQSMKQGAIDVRGVVIANCGHFVPEEQPQELDGKVPDLAEQIGSLENKILIDAGNPYPNRDGEVAQKVIDDESQTATGYIASLFPKAKTVKAFNSVAAEIFDKQAFKEGDERFAVQICSDDEQAKETVKKLIEDIGFAPQDLGDLSQGVLFEPDAPLYNQNLKLPEAQKLLSQIKNSDRSYLITR